MKRRIFLMHATSSLLALAGCGSDPPVPADQSNLPPEVKAEEEKFEAANAKRKADADKRAARGR